MSDKKIEYLVQRLLDEQEKVAFLEQQLAFFRVTTAAPLDVHPGASEVTFEVADVFFSTLRRFAIHKLTINVLAQVTEVAKASSNHSCFLDHFLRLNETVDQLSRTRLALSATFQEDAYRFIDDLRGLVVCWDTSSLAIWQQYRPQVESLLRNGTSLHDWASFCGDAIENGRPFADRRRGRHQTAVPLKSLPVTLCADTTITADDNDEAWERLAMTSATVSDFSPPRSQYSAAVSSAKSAMRKGTNAENRVVFCE